MHWGKKITATVTAFAVGMFSGYTLGYKGLKAEGRERLSEIRPIRSATDDHKLISPLIAYDLPESKDFEEFRFLESEIKSIIERYTPELGLKKVSLYFRDLNSGKWVGINENASYRPASLLKVPVMIAYFKRTELDPMLLGRTITYIPPATIFPNEIVSLLVPYKDYTTEEMIRAMIKYSDNGAVHNLFQNINSGFLEEVFSDLGIGFPDGSGDDYFISAKNYSLFFRTLYNATYLNRTLSEKALRLLSDTEFKEGIVAGLPPGTTVAHKFGEREISENGVIAGVELHDCGIVYYPDHPYLICVFSAGSDIIGIKNLIQELSRTAYTQMNGMYRWNNR